MSTLVEEMEMWRYLLMSLVAFGPACDEPRSPPAPPPAAPPADAAAETDLADPGNRIVTAGGTVTEIVFALGAGDRVVAVDTSSVYPAEAAEKPNIGFFRKLSAEPLMSVRPSALLVMDSAGPDEALEQIEAVGVPVHRIDSAENLAAARERIEALGELLGARERADELVRQLDEDVKLAKQRADEVEQSPRVLFVYARGPNVLMVGGRDTGATRMLELAGAESAIDEFEGFKPMTAEAVVAAKPEVIVMTTRGAESLGGWEGVSRLPGVAHTPAAEDRRLVTVDDLALLGFGPRTGEALLELQRELFTDEPTAEPAE